MNVNGKHFETIWLKKDNPTIIQIIDQRFLPFKFKIENLSSPKDVFTAIKDMHVRGAPLIGVAAALGMYLGLLKFDGKKDIDQYVYKLAEYLNSSRPTAINLKYATDKICEDIAIGKSLQEKINLAKKAALNLLDNERENCKKIGEYGYSIIETMYKKKHGNVVNILTHCNAGWLACIDYGTATAPIYLAHDNGIKIHVWVDETRPRNQGARLTLWELSQHGIPCTLIADNTGGHLMQNNMIDLVIVGSDRTTVNGDVANKIGTYLKALAAKDNNIPFYVALPSSSIDFSMEDGLKNIPIEERDANEVKYIEGWNKNKIIELLLTEHNLHAANYAFDVTPARLVTSLITERGVCEAKKNCILELFSDKLK